MTQNQLPTRITPRINNLTEAMLCRIPRVIAGENEGFQKEYLRELLVDLNPKGFLEEQWVEDVFDHTWNLWRYRNLKTAFLNEAAYEGLLRTLANLIGPTDAVVVATQWHAKDANAFTEVDDILRSAGLSFEVVMAQTLAIKLAEIEAIDRLIAEAEAQRNAALRELDRHRALLGQEVRRAIERVEDVEFKPVDESDGGQATQ